MRILAVGRRGKGTRRIRNDKRKMMVNDDDVDDDDVECCLVMKP
jgi:hypothetical protein